MIEAVKSGGRDGFIGGEKGVLGCLGHGHGHGHEQKCERAHLSAVAAPLGSSPEARHEYAVLTTTSTGTTNHVLDSINHMIGNALDTLDTPSPVH